ncbi:MAG: rhodanese-like domain-containing protein [Planctomycetota bacterium]
MKLPSSTLGQTAAFSGLVLVLALLNTVINPTAIDLGRDYFPSLGGGSSIDPGTGLSTGLPQHDFGVMDLEMMLEFLPEFAVEGSGIVLIDARSEDHFEAGRIPGAKLLDHYRKQDYIDAVLPAMQEAGYVVIYCKGGDCEDSIHLATDLVYHHGIEKEVLYIYEGGIDEWEKAGHPIAEGK